MWPIAPFVPKCQRMLTNSVRGGVLSSNVPYPYDERRPRNWPYARLATTSASTATTSNDGRFNALPSPCDGPLRRSFHFVDEPVERHHDVKVLEAELGAQDLFDVGARAVLLDHLRQHFGHALRAGSRLAHRLLVRDSAMPRYDGVEVEREDLVESSCLFLRAAAAGVVDELWEALTVCEQVAGRKRAIVREQYDDVAVGMAAAEVVNLGDLAAQVHGAARLDGDVDGVLRAGREHACARRDRRDGERTLGLEL